MGNVIFNSPMGPNYMGVSKDMAINVEEIKRVIDDFDSKASYYHKSAEDLYNKRDFETSARVDAKSHAFEYCSMVLRQVLPRD